MSITRYKTYHAIREKLEMIVGTDVSFYLRHRRGAPRRRTAGYTLLARARTWSKARPIYSLRISHGNGEHISIEFRPVDVTAIRCTQTTGVPHCTLTIAP